VVAYFAVLGLSTGVWLARIPAVKQNLQLTDGVLGLALLAAPAGLVVVVPFAGRIVHMAGSRRPTLIAGVCTALVLIGLGLAPSLPVLMAALFAFGLAGGLLDVGMNSQAVLVERAAGRPMMTSFHSCYSFGALGGALFGGAFAWAGIGPAVNFVTISVPLALAAILAGRWLLTEPGGSQVEALAAAGPADVVLEDQAGDPGPHRARMTKALLLMALLATCSLLGEGAADGWSAVYLKDNLGASAGLAAVAYAGFSVAMAFGRLSGDRLAQRFGAVWLMRCCGLVAAAGLSLALLSHSPAGAIAGFTIFGAGLSSTFPLLLSAAGNADPARPAHGIARVAGFGYVGMLGGPVLIGGLASTFGLQRALAVPVVLALVVAAGASVVVAGRAGQASERPAARPISRVMKGWVGRQRGRCAALRPGRGAAMRQEGPGMDDKDILGHIDELITTEHQLRDKLAKGELSSEDEQVQLRATEEALDQCWDLLRQRRARRQYGEDPAESAARPVNEVEGYLQ
jgi:MFS family permease